MKYSVVVTPFKDGPDSLLHLTAQFLATHPAAFCSTDKFTGRHNLREDVALPSEICDKLLSIWQDINAEKLCDKYIEIFSNPFCTRVKCAVLKNSIITDAGLTVLLQHPLSELDITNCCKLSTQVLQVINKNGKCLSSLLLGNAGRIFPHKRESLNTFEESEGILHLPNLKKLVIQDVNFATLGYNLCFLVKPLTKLTYLDLSNCNFSSDFQYIENLQNLVSLTLYGVPYTQDVIPSLCKLKKLRFLDISQHKQEEFGTYKFPDNVLSTLVTSLPELSALDISGTNLSGDGKYKKVSKCVKVSEGKEGSKCMSQIKEFEELNYENSDIPGLESRVNSPLKFLGLFKTCPNACSRQKIPAEVITGDDNENQILAATAAYIDRPEVLFKVLNELYDIYRFRCCVKRNEAHSLVLSAMLKHKTDRMIQICGSASLYYIIKSLDVKSLSVRAKEKTVVTLLDALELHIKDMTMIRNGCFTLWLLDIPQDILFQYPRLVRILLHLLESCEEDFIVQVAIHLLNSLACQVDGDKKELIGDMGAIETMLKLIDERVNNKLHDEVLELAWSAMWNMTDETAVNCQRFLDGEGMQYFLRCLKEFSDRQELLRNMMGLLGNVAEVKSLRPRLIRRHLLATFADLLDSTSDGVEVSYNAAGVIAHIAADGEAAWTVSSPSREEVLHRMVEAIKRWDINSKRSINYRSFEPILRLLKVTHTPECQFWAIWALANLTRVLPDKYCSLVEAEGGLELLEEVVSTDTAYESIHALARTVISQCAAYREKRGSQDAMTEDCPSL